MAIGRRPAKKVIVPNNRTMHARANVQLENHAKARAEHFTESLKVDAPWFYFWSKTKGAIPCSCTAKREGFNTGVNPGGENQTTYTTVGSKSSSSSNFATRTEYIKADQPNKNPAELSMDAFIQTLNSGGSITKAPTVRPEPVEDKFLEDDFSDLDDAFDGVQDLTDNVTASQTDFHDPFNLFSDKTIQCAVCMDTGFIDAWSVHGGQRFVFESGPTYSFQCHRGDVDTYKAPYVIEMAPTGQAFWTVKLPYIWVDIARAVVFNGEEAITPDKYTWQWFDASSESISGIVSRESLNQINGEGKTLRLMLTFHEDVSFTHAEIIFLYSPPSRAQLPEIPQGYEAEFLDWNAPISVELPPDIQITEGCYLTESKYAKVWKVNSIVRKATAGGVVFGLTADLRALHPFEKKYTQFSLFSSPLTYERQVSGSGHTPTGGIDLGNFNWSGVEW